MFQVNSLNQPGPIPPSQVTLESRFLAQARLTIDQSKARQVPVTRAKAQTSGETVKVNLDEIEQAMMREMEKTLQKGRPE